MTEPTFDADGYPTEETLKAIAAWPWRESKDLLDFCRKAWRYPDYWRSREVGANEGRHFLGYKGTLHEVSTGGWSGNESIISALEENCMFMATCWIESRRGGHYIFQLPHFMSSSTETKKDD